MRILDHVLIIPTKKFKFITTEYFEFYHGRSILYSFKRMFFSRSNLIFPSIFINSVEEHKEISEILKKYKLPHVNPDNFECSGNDRIWISYKESHLPRYRLNIQIVVQVHTLLGYFRFIMALLELRDLGYCYQYSTRKERFVIDDLPKITVYKHLKALLM